MRRMFRETFFTVSITLVQLLIHFETVSLTLLLKQELKNKEEQAKMSYIYVKYILKKCY